jgi:hypothetical protein
MRGLFNVTGVDDVVKAQLAAQVVVIADAGLVRALRAL